MLHKCANPPCSTLFRKMSEGRLFQLPRPAVVPEGKKPRHAGYGVEYFWLCDQCSPSLTLQFDPEFGVVPVPVAINFDLSAGDAHQRRAHTRGSIGGLRCSA